MRAAQVQAKVWDRSSNKGYKAGTPTWGQTGGQPWGADSGSYDHGKGKGVGHQGGSAWSTGETKSDGGGYSGWEGGKGWGMGEGGVPGGGKGGQVGGQPWGANGGSHDQGKGKGVGHQGGSTWETMSGRGGYSGWEGGNSWGTGEGGVLEGGKGGCEGKGGQVWGADRLRLQAMHYMSQAAQMSQMNLLANTQTIHNIANCNW